jgi:hypothetical protein
MHPRKPCIEEPGPSRRRISTVYALLALPWFHGDYLLAHPSQRKKGGKPTANPRAEETAILVAPFSLLVCPIESC